MVSERISHSVTPVSLNSDRDLCVVNVQQDSPRNTPPHHHKLGQLFASRAGALAITSEQQQWVMPAGYAVWVPPNYTHSVSSVGAFNGWSLYISYQASTGLSDKTRVIKVSELLLAVVNKLQDAYHTLSLAHYQPLAQVAINEISQADTQKFHLAMPQSPAMQQLANEILNHPATRYPVEYWAAKLAMSARSFARHFHQQTGLPFATWCHQARMLLALQLLPHHSVKQVALELGYDNNSSFSQSFNKQFGISPSAYQQQS